MRVQGTVVAGGLLDEFFSLGSKRVKGLFSAVVTDSAFARVRMVLVRHIKNENEREKVAENQATHNMQMTHV